MELMEDEARDLLVHRCLNAALASLVITVLGAAALALVLAELGYNRDLYLVPAWLLNLNTARQLGRAAQAQHRNAWLHGIVAAIWPVTAMLVLGYLYTRNVQSRAR